MNRALGEAADLNDFFNTLEPVIGRIYARTASFCTERSGHYDAFDQGITFFLPNGSWIQPPGYVHTMITNTWANQSLNVVYNQQDGQEASVRPGTRFRAGSGAPAVSISAQKKQDGSQLVVRVTNSALSPSAVYIAISGATVNPTVTVWQMTANNANAANAPSNPTYVSPQQVGARSIQKMTLTSSFSFQIAVTSKHARLWC
jgi:alpha-L-arabinofuranosidase